MKDLKKASAKPATQASCELLAGSLRQMGVYSDAMIDSLKRITSVVHENEGVIAVQLAHAGQKGIAKDEYSAVGPSDMFEAGVKKRPQ